MVDLFPFRLVLRWCSGIILGHICLYMGKNRAKAFSILGVVLMCLQSAIDVFVAVYSMNHQYLQFALTVFGSILVHFLYLHLCRHHDAYSGLVGLALVLILGIDTVQLIITLSESVRENKTWIHGQMQ